MRTTSLRGSVALVLLVCGCAHRSLPPRSVAESSPPAWIVDEYGVGYSYLAWLQVAHAGPDVHCYAHPDAGVASEFDCQWHTAPGAQTNETPASNDLDIAIIRRYIQRNIKNITVCYERQLSVKPALSGTVVVHFLIAPDGGVASANGSGLDSEVDNCVAVVIQNIAFPKPKGGGAVQVNYPFNFRPLHAADASAVR